MTILKEKRLEADLDIQEVADRTGLAYESVRKYEVGNPLPGPKALKALCDLYGLDPETAAKSLRILTKRHKALIQAHWEEFLVLVERWEGD